MPFNGSGTYTLPQSPFVPNTVISSSNVNSDFSDIASNGLSNVICKDGQSTLTGALKGFAGSVSLPAYSFSADLDSGMYRIGANNIGISVNATKILDIGVGGLSVVGTLSSTGAYSPAGQILAGDGTVLLPEYSFTSEPASGIYRKGTNDIGVAVNAIQVLDISATGLNVLGTVASSGAVLTPQAQAAGMVNGTIVESHTGNAVTFAIKTLAGSDPSVTDIVYFVFRNATPGTGNYVVVQVTAALSLVVSSGSTLGTSNNVAFKLWLVAFNDASTVRLGIINTVSGVNIYPLGQFPVASSTAEGGSGAADSAQVFYTGTAVTSKAYSLLAYAAYETGITTAGNWAASPTRINLHTKDTPLPGAVIQTVGNSTGAAATCATALPFDNTTPQNNEGNQVMTQAMTITSNTNVVEVSALVYAAQTAAQSVAATLFQDANANALATSALSTNTTSNNCPLPLRYRTLAPQASSTTFNVRLGTNSGTAYFNADAGHTTGVYNATCNSYIEIQERMT